MSDKETTGRHRFYLVQPDDESRHASWKHGEMILTEALMAYVPQQALEVCALRCIICRRRIGTSPLVLIFLSSPDICYTTFSHIVSATVARHEDCGPPSPEILTDMIIESVGHCFT